MLAAISVTIAFAIATSLLVAASSKTVRPRVAANGLVQLGVPQRVSARFVAVGIVVEWLLAAGVLLRPASLVVELALFAAFAAFAALGIRGLRQAESIECGCFGGLGFSTYGWLQVWQLLVVAACLPVLRSFCPTPGPGTGLALFALAQLAGGATALAFISPVWFRVRRDRRSLGNLETLIRPFLIPAERSVGPTEVQQG